MTTTTTDTAALDQSGLVDLDAELADLTAPATVPAAESAAAGAARRERRAMNAAWASLVAGIAISMACFASIAWHDSVAANGTPATSVASTTP
jgi:formate/nitrite transporter FocA (FNT family)